MTLGELRARSPDEDPEWEGRDKTGGDPRGGDVLPQEDIESHRHRQNQQDPGVRKQKPSHAAEKRQHHQADGESDIEPGATVTDRQGVAHQVEAALTDLVADRHEGQVEPARQGGFVVGRPGGRHHHGKDRKTTRQ